MSESIKSRPVYEPVEIDSQVLNHVFISENNLIKALKDLYLKCGNENKQCWVITDNSDLEAFTVDAEVIQKTKLTEELTKKLINLPISTNLYLAAYSESFLWDVHRLAQSLGFADEQIKKLQPLTKERRLFCTHCYTMTEGVTHSPFECPGCKRLLLVRDHFSKIHGAYVGVQINAEDPCDIPESEEVA